MKAEGLNVIQDERKKLYKVFVRQAWRKCAVLCCAYTPLIATEAKMRNLTPPPRARVSIIVPFYNAENHLERCVQSLVGQSYADIEMIFINDGSTDASREIVAGYQQKDARIVIIDTENSGAGMARKTGLAKASGTYLMFCDSDDYYEPCMVARMVALIEEESNIDLAMCSARIVDESISSRDDKEYLRSTRNGIYPLTQDMKKNVNIPLWNKIFKMDPIREYDIDFVNLKMHGDENFIYKYLCIASKINFTSSHLYNRCHRLTSLSAHASQHAERFYDYVSCFENIMDFMKKRSLIEQNQQYFANLMDHAVDFIKNNNLNYSNIMNNVARRLRNLIKELDFNLIDADTAYNLRKLNDKVYGDEYSKDTIPIIISSDKNYVKYVSVTLQSIMGNARSDRNYLIIILDCGIDRDSIATIESQMKDFPHFKLVVVSVEDFLKQHEECFVEKGLFTAAIYGRLSIPEICSDFERAIYVDIDMIWNRDISELADIDLEDNYIAAVMDPIEIERRSNEHYHYYIHKKLSLKEDNHYINSGLIVFNIKKWKELSLSEKCIEMLQDEKDYYFPDQDVINVVCKNKIHYLPQNWNCTCVTKHVLSKEKNIKAINSSNFLGRFVNQYLAAYYGEDTVFHYVSHLKPWAYPAWERSDRWWFYCRQTPYYEEIFLELQQKNALTIEQKGTTIKKLTVFGLPLACIKKFEGQTKIWLLGMRLFKTKIQDNKKKFYFLFFRLATQEIQT